jgi:hypothetical protein
MPSKPDRRRQDPGQQNPRLAWTCMAGVHEIAKSRIRSDSQQLQEWRDDKNHELIMAECAWTTLQASVGNAAVNVGSLASETRRFLGVSLQSQHDRSGQGLEGAIWRCQSGKKPWVSQRSSLWMSTLNCCTPGLELTSLSHAIARRVTA